MSFPLEMQSVLKRGHIIPTQLISAPRLGLSQDQIQDEVKKVGEVVAGKMVPHIMF